MANKRSDYQERERGMWSGKSGERERNSSGRTPGEFDRDSDEMRGKGAISESSRQSDDKSYGDVGSLSRRPRDMSPDLEEDSGSSKSHTEGSAVSDLEPERSRSRGSESVSNRR
jgi:hypothetical protein